MKKTAYIIWNDFYHKKEVIAKMLPHILPPQDWTVFKSEHMRDLLHADFVPDVALFFTNGKTDDESEITFAEQDEICNLVEKGMGILFYHAGMVLIEKESPYNLRINSGRFLIHPEQCPVTVTPLSNVSHEITKGISSFTQKDEHYFCDVDISKTNLLACASSEHGTTASVWCHSYGKGRVVGITQGHTEEMQNDGAMCRLTAQAILWAAHK